MKKNAFLLVIALSLQSCFSMRPIAIESELQRNHIGRSSTSDLKVMLGPPNEQLIESTGNVWLYYTNHKNYEKRTTRFSFDDNGIVRNVISDDFVYRKRFDGGATVLCILFTVGAVIAIPVIIVNSSN